MTRTATVRTAGSPVDLRRQLLALASEFVFGVRAVPGVERVALLGSMLTEKAQPKDIDLLLTIGDACDLSLLAPRARRLSGRAQSLGAGADVFLAGAGGRYLGRICLWRVCQAGVRVACDANHCGRRRYLHDDLRTISLPEALTTEPPLEIFPIRIARVQIPADVADWSRDFSALAT
jgi:hypothetical protein